METYPVAWGLDIGLTTIKAVKLQRTGTGATVLGYAIAPITVAEGGDRDDAIVQAIAQLAVEEEFGDAPVVAAISGRQVYSKSVNIPVLNEKKIHTMIELEARQQIPGNFDDVEWGYHKSPGADGSSIDVALFAAKREVIEEVLAKGKKAGINIVGVSLSSLGLYNFVQFDQQFPADEAVIILDVGAENTDLVIYQGERLSIYNLGLSGNDITKAFAKKFRVSSDEAEKLKREVDQRQADKILKVIEGTLNELASDIHRRLGQYKQANPDAKLDNLVISGNTFRLAGLPEYFAERLRYTVNILEDLDRIQVTPGIERDNFMHDLQCLGVAMGLALQGVGGSKANVNLMPSQMRLQRTLTSKRWAAVAAVALVGVTFAVDWSVRSRMLDENKALYVKAEKFYKDNDRRQSTNRAVLDTVGPKAQTLKRYAPYGQQRGSVLAVLDGVAGVVQAAQLAPELQIADRHRKFEDGGNPWLLPVYLKSVELPAYRHEAEGGPFSPFAAEREVTVVVHIPKSPKFKQVQLDVLRRLRELGSPSWLEAHQPGSTLFEDVQATKDETGGDTFHYIDRGKLNDQGQVEPVQLEKRVPVIATTFKCKLTGKGKELAAGSATAAAVAATQAVVAPAPAASRPAVEPPPPPTAVPAATAPAATATAAKKSGGAP